MSHVEISCPRDPVIEEHCRREFQAKFDRVLSLEGSQTDKLTLFAQRLRKEAQLQKWYDYTEVGEPTDPTKTGVSSVRKRQVIYENGKPKLLVPEVRIVDE
jgi:hypothetical protein